LVVVPVQVALTLSPDAGEQSAHAGWPNRQRHGTNAASAARDCVLIGNSCTSGNFQGRAVRDCRRTCPVESSPRIAKILKTWRAGQHNPARALNTGILRQSIMIIGYQSTTVALRFG